MADESEKFDIQKINLKSLAGVFNKRTNSYKFLFFLSLLDCVKNSQSKKISFTEITTGMLYWAWYPYSYYRLSFGKQDQVTKILDQLKEEDVDLKNAKEKIMNFVKNNSHVEKTLMEYVPFRFLTPFIKEIEGANDGQKNKLIQEISKKHIHEALVPYTLEENSLILNDHWFYYLKSHFHFLQEWTSWHWGEYMQSKNPSTPAVSKKLHPIINRTAFKREIVSDWTDFLIKNSFQCIFSGKDLKLDNFHLDHFIPWKFVAHNEPWNLLPIDPSTNSSKSDRIPDIKVYLEPFVQVQLNFLSFLYDSVGESNFQKKTEGYLLDLKVRNSKELLEFEKLLTGYQSTVEPLSQLALQQGFQLFSTTK